MNNILKGELSMINIKYNDSYEIISQGIIDLGVLGKYTEDKFEISTQYDRFDIERMSENERDLLIADLNKKYNDYLKKVEINIKGIENRFIICFFKYLIDIDFEFDDYENISFISDSVKDREKIYSKVSGDN